MCEAINAPKDGPVSDMPCDSPLRVAASQRRYLTSSEAYTCGFRPDLPEYWIGLSSTGIFGYAIAVLVLVIAALRTAMQLARSHSVFCREFLPKPRKCDYTRRKVTVLKVRAPAQRIAVVHAKESLMQSESARARTGLSLRPRIVSHSDAARERSADVHLRLRVTRPHGSASGAGRCLNY